MFTVSFVFQVFFILSFPENHRNEKATKCTSGIHCGIPHIGRTGTVKPVLPTFIRDSKTGAKSKKSPREPSSPTSKCTPTQQTHQAILNKMQSFVW
jgi:hypothetical protein